MSRVVYTKNEVMQYVKEEDVKFIRLAFCDVYGKQKNISIMPGELARAFESGISIDASAVSGFGGEASSDLLLFPDPSTLCVLPWRPSHGRVVRMFCFVRYPDGRDFERDSRRILKDAVQNALEKGYAFSFGAEIEFYLFKTDDEGNPTGIPFDTAHYMDIAPLDKGENVRREICLTLERMGIRPESSHHEEGPGQNEIDFRFSDPVTAADDALTFLWVVKTVAEKNGLYADFLPKPIKDAPGSGMHINISVTALREKKDLHPYAVSGIMNRISDMTAFLNPCENSYERLGKNKAPSTVTWAAQNRNELIRIPAAWDEYRRIELRSPDAMLNPYLAYALIIYAVTEGIERGELLQAAVYAQDENNNDKDVKKLPQSLAEAKQCALQSEFLRRVLPNEIIQSYSI